MKKSNLKVWELQFTDSGGHRSRKYSDMVHETCNDNNKCNLKWRVMNDSLSDNKVYKRFCAGENKLILKIAENNVDDDVMELFISVPPLMNNVSNLAIV